MSTMCLNCKKFIITCSGAKNIRFTECEDREVVNLDTTSMTSDDIKTRIKQVKRYFYFNELDTYSQLVEEGITPSLLIKRGMFQEAKHMREFCASHGLL